MIIDNKHCFYVLTLNQGEEEPGTRGWSLYRRNELGTALRMPGLRVILSTDSSVPCQTSVLDPNNRLTILRPCTLEYALERMTAMVRCYEPQPVHGMNMREFRHSLLLDLRALQDFVKRQEKLRKENKPVLETDNLNFINGLSPATSDNCPNIPADPTLTGEAPFDGQDPMWFDYQDPRFS